MAAVSGWESAWRKGHFAPASRSWAAALSPDSGFDIVAIGVDQVGRVVAVPAIFRCAVVSTPVLDACGMECVHGVDARSDKREMQRTMHAGRERRAVVITPSGTDLEKGILRRPRENHRAPFRLSLHNGNAQRCEAVLIERDAPQRIRNKNADVVKHAMEE